MAKTRKTKKKIRTIEASQVAIINVGGTLQDEVAMGTEVHVVSHPSALINVTQALCVDDLWR